MKLNRAVVRCLAVIPLVAAPVLAAQPATASPLTDSIAQIKQASDALSAPVHEGISTVERAASAVTAGNSDAHAAVESASKQAHGQVEASRTAVHQATKDAYDYINQFAVADMSAYDGNPSYVWSNDPLSQFMAGRPGPVLHRVPGSWFSSPDIPKESRDAEARGVSLYGPGTPVFVDDGMCTLTAAGYDSAGRKIGITAGHCGQPGTRVTSADSPNVGVTGTIVRSNKDLDYAVIVFNDRAEVTRSYNGVTIDGVGGRVDAGNTLCKRGVATGHSCGITWISQPDYNINQVCARPGDSGGPVIRDGRLVGMINGGVLPYDVLACNTPLQGAAFMPTVSNHMDPMLADMEATGGPGQGFHLPSN